MSDYRALVEAWFDRRRGYSDSQPRDENGRWTRVGVVVAWDTKQAGWGIGAETTEWIQGGKTDTQFSYQHESTQKAAETFAEEVGRRRRKKTRVVKTDKIPGSTVKPGTEVFDIEVWIPDKKKK